MPNMLFIILPFLSKKKYHYYLAGGNDFLFPFSLHFPANNPSPIYVISSPKMYHKSLLVSLFLLQPWAKPQSSFTQITANSLHVVR